MYYTETATTVLSVPRVSKDIRFHDFLHPGNISIKHVLSYNIHLNYYFTTFNKTFILLPLVGYKNLLLPTWLSYLSSQIQYALIERLSTI